MVYIDILQVSSLNKKIEKSIFLIDINGKILRVICDDLDLYSNIVGDNFLAILDKDSQVKFLSFLINVRNNNAEIFWDMNFNLSGKIEQYYVTGAKVNNDIITLITKYALELGEIYEDLIKINNEQINYFRSILKQFSLDKQNQDKTYLEMLDEISRLNNELANIQRELVKKNLELEELNKKLSEMAIKDQLTGLYNRRYFNEVFAKEVAKAKRYGIKLSLVSVDLNNFKIVNDTFGHAAGDRLLIEFAQIALENTRRDVDYIFRFGGDEFLFLLVGANSEDAKEIINRIDEKLRNINNITSLAYGMVEVDLYNEVDIEKLIIHTDKLMYEHKRKVKGIE